MLTTLLALIASFAPADQIAETDRLELARYFGFGEMQIYNFDRRAFNLELADIDGDGVTDIIVWDPTRSRLEVFLQPGAGESEAAQDKPADAAQADAPSNGERKGRTRDGDNEQSTSATRQPNKLTDLGGLRRVPVPISGRVADFQVAELTGDEHADIVYFGEPRELVLLAGQGDVSFGPPQRIRAPEGRARGGSLVVGDFNSDGRSDVVLFAEDALLMYYQKKEGGLKPAEKVPHDLANALFMLVADVNGDGRDDLLVARDDAEYAAALFLQESGGGLGARRRVALPALRSLTVEPREDAPALVLSTESATDRLKLYRWGTPPGTALGDWPMMIYAYPAGGDSNRRPVAKGDLNGDGHLDLVAAAPDAAQLVVFFGAREGLRQGVAYPGLVETTDLAVADLDQDGRAEVLAVSKREKMVGVSRYEDGRLTFPTALRVTGTPLAVTAGALSRGADASERMLAVLVEQEDDEGERSNAILLIDPRSRETRQTVELERLRDNPDGLMLADIDHDGDTDLLVFVEFDALRTLLQQDDGTFAPLETAGGRTGLVQDAKRVNATLADVNGDGNAELLLAQRQFARALRVENGAWTVVDQYNPEGSDADLRGLASLPTDGGAPRLVTYDSRSQRLLVWERDEDRPYRVTRRMPIGTFNVQLLAARGEPEAEVWLVGARKLAVFSTDAEALTLVEQRTYESEADDATLSDSVVGDVNNDGVTDVVVVDNEKASLEILTTLPGGDWVRVHRFQVFQGKQFSAVEQAFGEPREVLLGDVTGDGIEDIVLLVHDRLLVYPGE